MIGFYFGSRAVEGPLDKRASAADGGGPDWQKVDADLKSFDGDMADATARLDALKSASRPEAGAAAFDPALPVLLPAGALLGADRTDLIRTMAEGRPLRMSV